MYRHLQQLLLMLIEVKCHPAIFDSSHSRNWMMERGLMKRSIKVFLLLLGISLIICYGIYWSFYDISRLETGELIAEVESPTGEYTLKAYLVNGGATVSYAVRGELNYNIKNKSPKNIYWDYPIDEAVITWIDNEIVVINGHTIHVLNDIYDFRRDLR